MHYGVESGGLDEVESGEWRVGSGELRLKNGERSGEWS